MRPSPRPFVRAAVATFAVLAIGAVLPIWQSYFAGPSGVTGKYTPLWTAMARLPDSRHVPHTPTWEAQWTNVVAGVLLLAFAGAVGRAEYRFGSRPEVPDEVGDFRDGPEGSIPDGRSGPPDS